MAMAVGDGRVVVRNAGAAALALAILALSVSPLPAALVARTGTFKISGTVTLSANVPTTATLTANASVSFYSPGSFGGQSEEATGSLTRSGNTATVQLSIPYTWFLDSASVDTTIVTVDLNVSAGGTASAGTQTSTSVPVPAAGATTPETFALAM